MSEPTELSPYQQAQQQAAALGGTAWIEEVLIRGQPDGSIKGAHLMIGIQAPEMAPILRGPLPLEVLGESVEWDDIASALNVAALDQVNTLQQQINELQQLIQQSQN